MAETIQEIQTDALSNVTEVVSQAAADKAVSDKQAEIEGYRQLLAEPGQTKQDIANLNGLLDTAITSYKQLATASGLSNSVIENFVDGRNLASGGIGVIIVAERAIVVESQEIKPPTCTDAPQPGQPTIPGTCYGNTPSIITLTNNNREHVCDFILELKKNFELGKYIKAVANVIREALKWILKQISFGDPSGEITKIANLLRSYAAELRRIQKEVIKPIIEFEKVVLAYVTKLRAIIQWVLSLPVILAKLLAGCLYRLLKLIASIFVDLWKQATTGLVDEVNAEKLAADEAAGIMGPTVDFNVLVDAAKDAVAATGDIISATSQAVALAVAIPTSLTIGLLVPVTKAELDAANNTISAYNTANPAIGEITDSVTLGGTNKLASWGAPTTAETTAYITRAIKPAF
jgi:hypothetical protein